MTRLPLARDVAPLPRSAERPVHRVTSAASSKAEQFEVAVDRVVTEEPLEIRIGADPIAVTMRTPGDDFDLAAGFLFTETAIASPSDIASIAYSTRAEDKERRNVVEVVPSKSAKLATEKAKRSFYAASSCGLCGKATIDAIHMKVAPITRAIDATTFSLERVRAMPDAMRAAQPTFDATGGLHAAAIFDAQGSLVVVREDVGRHNATDKAIGHMVRERRVPCRAHALMVSGRAGFEIVQKAAVAQIPLVAAVSAPSTLAIDLAESLGVTLVAFLRPPKASVYTHAWRVTA